ncbi:uncharacterized protein [Gossypium hirsutum]|uniref:Integrase zinc-binding domain-containing protein n=1 Tax=Gossypium hirsutum TaxID=3635 RepID=A0A1U8NYS1_GOSHI|nr:uncharacterized protein LOC107952379 [Gossypium hirsutum]
MGFKTCYFNGLSEVHSSPYATHPNGNKIYRDLFELYWWSSLKRVVTDFVAHCLTCQQVKAEHQFPSGSWEEYLPLAEFTYNNSFQSSIQMASYKDLYGHLKMRDIEYSAGDFVFPKLELPLKLDRIHDVFHVSMLKRYRSDLSHVVPVEEIDVRLDLTFEKEPVYILDRDITVLRRKSIPLVKAYIKLSVNSYQNEHAGLSGSGCQWIVERNLGDS